MEAGEVEADPPPALGDVSLHLERREEVALPHERRQRE